MLKPRRRVAVGIAAAASALSLLVTAVPAQAVVPVTPVWPTAGRVPTGCDPTVAIGGTPSAWVYGFTDSTIPVITDVKIGSGPITVLPPAAFVLRMSARVTDPCGGVLTAVTDISHNGQIIGGSSLTNTTADPFASWWSAPVATVGPDDGIGVWSIPFGLTLRRYDSVVLDKDFKVVGTPVATLSAQSVTVGPWAAKRFYVVRAMTLSNALSAAKVTKGRTVKATAVLKMATNAGYLADASDKVVVQTKVGTGTWTTRATLTTNASGVVSYSFVLTATTQVRFLHNRVLSGKYTNAVTSGIKTVTKI